MARRGRAVARKPKGQLQRLYDREQLEEATAPLVNRFAEQHMDCARNLRFVLNQSSTTIMRWTRDKNNPLTDGQQAAILHCQRLWAKLRAPRLVVDMEATGGGDGAAFNIHQIEALDDLHRIAKPFGDYWNVFENVCRHDLPAGVAGSHLMTNRRSAETAARTIVAFVADMIAMRENLSY
jgi:hypothetical protein